MPAPLASSHNSGLHRFAVLTAIATFGLVGIGGLVTSHGAGMAVPDWPNSYGYNMFFFPVSQWVGGIFYEHTHRLAASGVGLLTVVLALWLYGRSARPFMRGVGAVLMLLGAGTAAAMTRRWADGLVLGLTGLAFLGASLVWPRCEPSPKWLRRLGLAAFGAVVLQGVLGGLRVVLFKDAIGVFHAMLAQLFFVLLCAIALFTSRWWQTQPARTPSTASNHLTTLFFLTTLLILGQLTLGAAMRHQHAGLAIPDFPLAYGKLWPAMDADSIAHYNQQRIEVVAANPISAYQIGLQMVHRMLAMAILGAVAYAAWSTRRARGNRRAAVQKGGRAFSLAGRRSEVEIDNAGGTPGEAGETPAPLREPEQKYLSRLALAWLGVILSQVALGAATIWLNKAADIATAHVLIGALSLAFGAILCIVSGKELMWDYRVTDLSTAKGARPLTTLKPLASGVSGLPQS
jgi:cytochrome c oxidase assembly protein subunit 15